MKEKEDIFQSVVSKSITEITSDILEAGIDQFIDNDFIKDIPIFGTGFKLFSLTQKISESFFTKKIIMFLFQLKNIPQEKRVEFIKYLEGAPKTKKAGENVLVILNRLDDINKAGIIGKLFKATIEKKITFSDFLRLSHIVDKVFLGDLNELKENPELYGLKEEVKGILHHSGLLTQKIKDNRAWDKYLNEQVRFGGNDFTPSAFEFEINNFGRLLVTYGI